ncbi:hypothetical protein Taro_043064, partial [Colocasia esculenta]|nr:hypothetical protein [Colocasia esculenta]
MVSRAGDEEEISSAPDSPRTDEDEGEEEANDDKDFMEEDGVGEEEDDDEDGKGEGGDAVANATEGFRTRRMESSDEYRKSQNIAALVRGNLTVARQPLIPRLLSVSDGAAIARKPFKPPFHDGYSDRNEELVRRLCARKRFVPWGSSRPALVVINSLINIPTSIGKDPIEPDQPLPPGIEPLILWQPDESKEGNVSPIIVDPLLVRYLRPHQ